MGLSTIKPQKVIRIATIATLTFMVCWGLVLVLAQIKPFWVDEWRVIYNLKYKNAVALWGPLDYMQQFPRTYLEVIKAFTSLFSYSYFTLRLPSFLAGVATIIFCYRLMKKLYPAGNMNRFLFVMILVSSYTFTEYFVQIKQYTMDILLSLVALWQLMELLKINGKNTIGKRRYIGLCISFLVVPFFSYTYPVAIAPVYIIMLLRGLHLLRGKDTTNIRRTLLLQWFPLFLCFTGIAVFYVFDVSQLMADSSMHTFWGHLMMDNGFSWSSFFFNFYGLFAQVGSGLVFSLIFGMLGIISFLSAIYKCLGSLKNKTALYAPVVLYSTLLLVIVLLLFIAGKLPVGEPRLNAFTIPSISILIIYFLDALKQKSVGGNFSRGLSIILYIGLIGHVYTKWYAGITGPEYARKMDIYVSTENAIILAQAQKLPIFITPEVAYPYDKTQNLPFLTTVPGDWVLKTFPAYKVNENTPVYALSNLNELEQCMRQLPPYITSVLVGDGRSFHIIRR